MHDKRRTKPTRSGRSGGGPVTVVKQGSAAVPIYQSDCRGSTRFTLAFYHNGRRLRRSFGSLVKAKEEARIVALKIQRGMSDDNDLRPGDRACFRAALDLLAPLRLPLIGVIEEYVECRRQLGGTPLLLAIGEYQSRIRGFEAGVTVGQVVEELIALKQQDRLSKAHLDGLRLTCREFARVFPGEISRIGAIQIEAWIRRGDHAARTRNNWLKQIKYLFQFAKRRGYLPKTESTAADGLKPMKLPDSEVGIFTPDQMHRLLHAATPEMVPFIAIGGFAGLRVAEIRRLGWSAVSLERRLIELRAGQAKTASRRLVPISDNLAAWLSQADQKTSLNLSLGKIARIHRLAETLGIPWPPNGLRHSYISYRIAEVKNAAQVALEAGNSPTIIFKHYRELVTEEDARAWFGIYPAGSVDSGDGAS
jgi:integrase